MLNSMKHIPKIFLKIYKKKKKKKKKNSLIIWIIH